MVSRDSTAEVINSNNSHGLNPAEKSKFCRSSTIPFRSSTYPLPSSTTPSNAVLIAAKSGKFTTLSIPEPSIDACHHSFGIVAIVCQPTPVTSAISALMLHSGGGNCTALGSHVGILGMLELGIGETESSGIVGAPPSVPHEYSLMPVLSLENAPPPPAMANAKFESKNPANVSEKILLQSSSSSPNVASCKALVGRLAAPPGPSPSSEMPGIAPVDKSEIAVTKVSTPPGISRSENASANLIFGNCIPPGDAVRSPVEASSPPKAN